MTEISDKLKAMIETEAHGSPKIPVFKEAVALLENNESKVRHLEMKVTDHDGLVAEVERLKAEIAKLTEAAKVKPAAIGAVSTGPSFAEIKAGIASEPRVQPVDPAAHE